jgi:VanZ family protein
MAAVRRTLSLWVPVVLWAALIFGLSSIPSLSSGLGTWDTVLRKGAHMTEYAILAVLLRRALAAELPALVAAVAYACTDEIHQTFVRGRHGTGVDVAIDGVGAAVGLLAFLQARRRLRFVA